MRWSVCVVLLAISLGCAPSGRVAGDGAGDDPTSPDGDPPGTAAFDSVRTAFHVHSVYSHDACDGEGIVDGEVDWECWTELRTAVCDSHLDYVALADHPNHMRDYSFAALSLHDASQGDELLSAAGQPYANRLRCDDGHRVLINVGFESTHTMPIGLQRHLAAEFYTGIGDGRTDLADAKDVLGALRDAGAVTGMAHSEESDISAEYIVASGMEVMEWYNPHGNVKHVADSAGDDPLSALEFLGGLESFMSGAAASDLVVLALLQQWPQEGFDKWRVVNASRPVTGIIGNDVHQNVQLGDVCSGSNEVLCQTLANVYPSSFTQLVAGGNLVLGDGDRFDSYLRAFRWFQNRTLIEHGNGGDLSPALIANALRQGRNYGLLVVFGEPMGFGFEAHVGGEVQPMGALVETDATLHVWAPTAPSPTEGGVEFSRTDAELAQIRAVVVRTDAAGSDVVAEIDHLGESVELARPAPGAYHVEVWVQPQHLRTALGPEAELADAEYLWLITNPIRVE